MKIAHNSPTLGREEFEATQRVLESGRIVQGPEIEAFENECCDFLGLPHGHAIAVSSGSAALFLALWVLDVSGSAVGCPVYACNALPNAITLAGARPVLLNSGPDSPNIDLDALLASGVQTAIVPHMFGFPIDLVRAKGIRVIDDGAQALGATVRGVPVGLQGIVGAFSFYATKLITTGGHGGMVVSRDKTLIDSVRDYRAFDGQEDGMPRFNFQMTEVQAAIGRVQLRKFPEFMRRRNEIFEGYRNAGIPVFDTSDDYLSQVRYRSVIKTSNPKKVIEDLSRQDIKTIVPVEEWELLGPSDQFPNASTFSTSTISLPTYPSLSRSMQSRVIEAFLNSVGTAA